jgi:peptide/nickel transport system permease protein
MSTTVPSPLSPRAQSTGEATQPPRRHAGGDVRRRFWQGVWVALKRRPSRIAGVAIVALFIFMAIAGPWLYPDRLPYDASEVYAPITWKHPLSTDNQGVDVLALVITGTRGVLLVAAAAGLVTMLIGTAAGLYA